MFVLFFVVACINTCWQTLRAWLPKFLQQGRGYGEMDTLYFNSLFYVVTEDYRAVLPSLTGASGIPLPSNRHCSWEVDVHGSYPTVNDATGPDGMLDPYTFYNQGEFQGPKRDSGSFTTSEAWGLTTAP